MTPAPSVESDLVITANGVNLSRGGMPILKEISFTIAEGEHVGLLGANGSGKTTLLRAILGLYPCQQGQITLLGQPIEHFRSWRQIGYVPQRASVSLHSTTVSEVVGSGTLANRPLGWSGKARRSAITEALETVGLTAQASEPYLHLSGGQQQRVLIARGIVNRPRLVIMDEPFAGVDTANQTAIATALRELSATWLIVLHETTALADLLTRALVLREGRLVYDSPVVPTEPHPRVPKRATSPGLLTGMEPTWTS